MLGTGYLTLAAGAAGVAKTRKRQALLERAREHGVQAMARTWVQGMMHLERLADSALMERPQAVAGELLRRFAAPV